jgi:uncharacterized repeat protein (TIGR01451 family)
MLAGCFGVSQNPSYFPFLLPTGDIIRTHAKPPGLGYFSDFDPHACRLEVRPLDGTNPVRTQHVLIATVYDDKDQPRRNRRVEWMVEGVGNIVEVDESGYFPGRGYKVDNKYAVSYTDYCEHKVTRGNANPNDDFVIRPGQTWCVISSAVEGDTHVTVYAPGISNWDKHKVIVTKQWVDAEWAFPAPAVNRAGTEHGLVTSIFRHTDHQPLANYRVRYRILDGPPAFFLPSRTPEIVVISDLSGRAAAGLVQAAPVAGVNRIGIEVIRPPDPTSPSGAGIVIGRGETTKEWQAPSVALTKTGPTTAAVGQDLTYTLTVTNTGRVETQAQTVRDVIPDAVQYVRSEPPATLDGNQLTWTLGALPAGQAHTIQAVFRAMRLGPVTNCANVTTLEGLHAEACATTQVTAPQLTVGMTAPEVGAVGAPIIYQITATNPGTGPATNVVLAADFDPGLEHESRANPVELRLGVLGAGETRNIPLTLVPRQPGRLINRLNARADGNLRARAEHAVLVQVARLTLTNTGPGVRYVDRPAVFDIRAANAGQALLTNVTVRDQLPAELAFTSATAGGQLSGNQVIWSLGTLAPGEERLVQLTARCMTLSPRAVNVAIAQADPGLQVQAEAALEIRGVPAFRLQVYDVTDPIEVGGRTTYKIEVTNQGSLPGNQVEIVALVPQQMRVLSANGPSVPRVEGQRITFPATDGLQPKQAFNYTVDVEALTPGDVRFHVELRSATLGEPVIEEESTRILPRLGSGAPAPATVNPPATTASPPASPIAPPSNTAPPGSAAPPPALVPGVTPGLPPTAFPSAPAPMPPGPVAPVPRG